MNILATLYFKYNLEDYCFTCAVRKIQEVPEAVLTASLETNCDLTCDACKKPIPEVKIRI